VIAPSRPWPGRSSRPKATACRQDHPREKPRETPRTALTCRKHTWYDAFGNRIEKAHDEDGAGGGSAVVTRFALDGWKNLYAPSPLMGEGRGEGFVGNENWDVWADLDGSSSLTTRYVRGDVIDQLFARIEEDPEGDIPYWYLTDHLGSIPCFRRRKFYIMFIGNSIGS
jgi:hypothetical protein